MANSYAQLETLFHKALDLPSSERADFVARVCPNDSNLRAELQKLLESHEQNLIDDLEWTHAHGASKHDFAEVAEAVGDSIGRYKLLEKIGEGGMGIVYMAEQTTGVRRKVALKIIRLGMDTRQVIARFEAERQALAVFDHPNITRVLDAGTTSTGRPYFVMELVRGVSLTEYAVGQSLSLNDRLRLFSQVCRAVHHAHQKGIIHRDLKPSNILITQFDGVPVPKVIDFGIAKAIGQQRLTDKTLFTSFASMVGTPQYMSPEQAEMSGLDIDIRSDIYSLGVILYELITGSTPIPARELKGLNPLALLETLREANIETPSLRLSRLQRASLDSESVLRKTAPSPADGLKRELDWISLKAIARDRRERYQSSIALAEDIERYLGGDPVDAAPPSRIYHLKKFVAKHRAFALGVGTVAAVLVVATTVCTIFALDSYRVSQDLVAANNALTSTVDKLKVAEKTIRQTALVEQYHSAISIAFMQFDLKVASQMAARARAINFVPSSEAAAPGSMPSASIQVFPGTMNPQSLFGLSQANLLANSLQPLRSWIEKQENFARGLENGRSFGFSMIEMSDIAFEDATAMTQEVVVANQVLHMSPDAQSARSHLPQVMMEASEFQQLTQEQMNSMQRDRQKIAEELRDEFYRSLVAEYRRVFGTKDPHVAESLNLLAACLIDMGKNNEAEARLRESLVIADEADRAVAKTLLSLVRLENPELNGIRDDQ